MAASNKEKLADLHRQLLQDLKESDHGLSFSEIADKTPMLTSEERVELMNQIIASDNVQLLQGAIDNMLCYHHTSAPAKLTPQQKTVIYSLFF